MSSLLYDNWSITLQLKQVIKATKPVVVKWLDLDDDSVVEKAITSPTSPTEQLTTHGLWEALPEGDLALAAAENAFWDLIFGTFASASLFGAYAIYFVLSRDYGYLVCMAQSFLCIICHAYIHEDGCNMLFPLKTEDGQMILKNPIPPRGRRLPDLEKIRICKKSRIKRRRSSHFRKSKLGKELLARSESEGLLNLTQVNDDSDSGGKKEIGATKTSFPLGKAGWKEALDGRPPLERAGSESDLNSEEWLSRSKSLKLKWERGSILTTTGIQGTTNDHSSHEGNSQRDLHRKTHSLPVTRMGAQTDSAASAIFQFRNEWKNLSQNVIVEEAVEDSTDGPRTPSSTPPLKR